MKKVAPKARSFDSESPFTMAAVACSRMPKCRFFPAGLSASKSPAPSYVSVVLFDGPRAAEPPRHQRMFFASAVQALARRGPTRHAWRIRWKAGQVVATAGRQFAALHQFNLGGACGVFGAIGGKAFRPMALRLSAAYSYASVKMFIDAIGHKKL